MKWKAVLAGAVLAAAIGAGPALADQVPTQYAGPTEPAKAPEKLKVTAITCLSILHGCVSPTVGLQNAGKELGWDVTVVDGGGNPRQQNSAILDAVSAGANVVVLVAVDPAAVQLGLKAAKDANVLVVSGSNGIDSPNPVVKPADGALGVAFDVGPNYAALGNSAAEWIIKDSDGKANIAIFSDKEFPSVLAFEAGLLEGLKKCTGCVVSPQQYFTGNQVGATLAQMTVGYLRANPDTNYIFTPFDPAAGTQVPAIAQAGLADKVKLISVLGDQQNLDFIRKGMVQVADAAYDNEYMGWAIADQIIRALNKQPLIEPHGENLPFTVLDKTNLPAEGSDWVANFDYKSKFLELWKGK
ncbi:MAG: sugar ABC transporter substrate-binding protein [Rhizobiales bacterium]|nr:sugar ABC transporter substrate-binding protein [Hyphomicrobiales bacterium]